MTKNNKALTVRKPVEILMPVDPNPDTKAALGRMIEQKISEMMHGSPDAIFEPFFQLKAITHEIRKRETVVQQRKWSYYYEEYGCLVCGTTNSRHFGIGMCNPCHSRTRHRLLKGMRRAALERPEAVREIRDLSDVAREALHRPL